MSSAEIRDRVRHRAGYKCEYCLLSEHNSPHAFHLEHIIARQHGGSDDPSNLALACHRCNLQKGPNLTGIDPESGRVVLLFHPRTDIWWDHFRKDGIHIQGTTPTGRATVRLLQMNEERRLDVRRIILSRGQYLW